MRNLCLILVFNFFYHSALASDVTWPEWDSFKQAMVSADGRVIDYSSSNAITTSEGQSYAMFFALVANDRAAFDRLLLWTEVNLAQGSFKRHAIAWLWGRNKHRRWQVLDQNTAVDANLWIAYNLLEAGRLWHDKRYIQKAYAVMENISKDITTVKALGSVLLPGKYGFVHANGYRINPSYYPPMVMRRLSFMGKGWSELDKVALKIIVNSSPKGYAPDWVEWYPDAYQWNIPDNKKDIGSYDAIRVYLWIGMMADSPLKDKLQKHFSPFIQLVKQSGHVPLAVNCLSGVMQGHGPIGFEAALMPWMSGRRDFSKPKALIDLKSVKSIGYYNSVLVLFGKGWYEKKYRFDKNGYLKPAWLYQNLSQKVNL